MFKAIERMEAMPAFLEAALREAGDDDLAVRESDAGFSLTEHACHLRDLEREGYLVRVRRILAEQTPDLANFDGAALARERGYQRQDAHAAARDFAEARRELLAIVGALGPADLARDARFNGRRLTLGELVRMIDEHDGEHRLEIERLLGDLEE